MTAAATDDDNNSHRNNDNKTKTRHRDLVSAAMIRIQSTKRRTLVSLVGVAGCVVAFTFYLMATQPKLRLQEGQCWKGTDSAQLERLEALQTTYELEEMFEGPGLLSANVDVDGAENRAACKFVDDSILEASNSNNNNANKDAPPTHFFKHPMQQLYRCFSWWEANPTKEPYLIVSRNAPGINEEFVAGFVDRLRDVFGVRVVHLRNTLQPVRGVVEYEKWRDQHSFAMRSPVDANKMRDSIVAHYGRHHPTTTDRKCSNNNSNNGTRTIPHIGVLDRQATRSLQNVGAIVRAIEAAVGVGEVQFKVSTFDKRSFQEQVEFMYDTDILVTPHGAHLKALPFLPNCARVLELMPAGHYLPYLFGSLAAVSGVDHSYVYLGDVARAKLETRVAMRNYYRKEEAGAGNLCPSVDLIADAVVDLVDGWRRCCEGE